MRKSPKPARDANPLNIERKKMREAAKYGTAGGQKHKIASPGKRMKIGEMTQGKKVEPGFKNPPKIVRVS
jgi:hypothetical protein